MKKHKLGNKFDTGKPEPSLVYYSIIKYISEVRKYGVEKYGDPEDWRHLDNAESRYLNALLRHVFEYSEGNRIDPDSGLPILAHIAANVMFLIEGTENGFRNEED